MTKKVGEVVVPIKPNPIADLERKAKIRFYAVDLKEYFHLSDETEIVAVQCSNAPTYIELIVRNKQLAPVPFHTEPPLIDETDDRV